MAKWIVIILVGIIFFSMVVPGCIKGCNRQIGIEKKKEQKDEKDNTEKSKEEEGEEEQDSTEETSGPGLLDRILPKEKVVVQQTFWVVTYSDAKKTQVVEKLHLSTPWRDTICKSCWYDILPDSAQTIQIIPPGWYENNTIFHQSPTVIYRGSFKGVNVANPPIGPRGDGPFIIQSPIMQ